MLHVSSGPKMEEVFIFQKHWYVPKFHAALQYRKKTLLKICFQISSRYSVYESPTAVCSTIMPQHHI
jgi:hypothetical protein